MFHTICLVIRMLEIKYHNLHRSSQSKAFIFTCPNHDEAHNIFGSKYEDSILFPGLVVSIFNDSNHFIYFCINLNEITVEVSHLLEIRSIQNI